MTGVLLVLLELRIVPSPSLRLFPWQLYLSERTFCTSFVGIKRVITAIQIYTHTQHQTAKPSYSHQTLGVFTFCFRGDRLNPCCWRRDDSSPFTTMPMDGMDIFHMENLSVFSMYVSLYKQQCLERRQFMLSLFTGVCWCLVTHWNATASTCGKHKVKWRTSCCDEWCEMPNSRRWDWL